MCSLLLKHVESGADSAGQAEDKLEGLQNAATRIRRQQEAAGALLPPILLEGQQDTGGIYIEDILAYAEVL